MLGKIEKLWQNQAQNGQPYLVLAIEGQRYSLWDREWLDKLREGDIVDYDWKQAGKFRNVTSIHLTNGDHRSYSPSDRSQQIARMSCLKSASAIFSNLDLEPKKKVRLTIAAAKHFEKYISMGEIENPPQDQEAPASQYPGVEDDLDL